MNLVIFDIDGTLTRTVDVDAACYAQAFRDVFGIRDLNTDWSAYRQSTDTGIAAEILQTHLRRDATDEELQRVQSRFVELIEAAHKRSPAKFAAMPGAAAALDHFRHNEEWAVAIATGGWERSARFKLRAAGLDVTNIPGAFADDDPARDRIINAAMTRAAMQHKRNAFARAVYVGDAIWDLRTAKMLGIPFIAIAQHDRAATLRHAGARHILPHLDPLDQLLTTLRQASIP